MVSSLIRLKRFYYYYTQKWGFFNESIDNITDCRKISTVTSMAMKRRNIDIIISVYNIKHGNQLCLLLIHGVRKNLFHHNNASLWVAPYSGRIDVKLYSNIYVYQFLILGSIGVVMDILACWCTEIRRKWENFIGLGVGNLVNERVKTVILST